MPIGMSEVASTSRSNILSNTANDNNPGNLYAAQVGAARAYSTSSSSIVVSSGNIMTVYNAKISLSFNGERIKDEQISFVLTDSDYDDHNMPMIYLSLAVSNSMYDSILANKDTATFYMTISLVNANSSSMSISKTIFAGEFTYIPSSTSPNYSEVLDKSNEFFSDAYKRIIVGLVSTQLNNAARKEFNQIYKDITCETLLSLALEGINAIVEAPTYNDWYDSILVPPMKSRNQLIAYLYDKNQFYDTYYRFFMDFEYCYLLSKAGNAIPDGRGTPSNIIIDIKELTDRESIYDGYTIKNGSYYITMNPADTKTMFDQSMDKVSNNIVSVSDEGAVQQIGLNVNSTYGSSQKNLYIRDTNTTLYKNELETDTVAIELVKKHIDPSIFTPNKMISISNTDKYAEYNGKYIMKYKKVFFNSTADNFIISVILGLKKVSNVIPQARISANTKPVITATASYSASRGTAANVYSSSATTTRTRTASSSATVTRSSDNVSSSSRGTRAMTK